MSPRLDESHTHDATSTCPQGRPIDSPAATPSRPAQQRRQHHPDDRDRTRLETSRDPPVRRGGAGGRTGPVQDALRAARVPRRGHPRVRVRPQHPRRAQPRPGQVRRLPVPLPQRADGGHRPGRHHRPDQGDRPLRLQPRRGVPDVRDADHRRRDQALLPRHLLVRAGAAPAPGAAARPDQGQRRARPAARPLPDRGRARRARSASPRRRSSRAWPRQRVHRVLAGRPARGGRRRGLPRRPPRLRGPRRSRASSTSSR